MNGVYLGQSGEDKSICNYFLYAIKSSELFFSLCFVVLALKNKTLSVDSVIVFYIYTIIYSFKFSFKPQWISFFCWT